MRVDSFFDSGGAGRIHVCRWMPEGTPRAVLQIVHGIAEYAGRYEDFALYLNSLGILVVAEDHMGHGESIGEGERGYFTGGWFTAMEDTYTLLQKTRAEFPELPYVLLGHSMGSFLVRTILQKHPDSGIAACIICGTGWQSETVLTAGIGMSKVVCKLNGERKPSKALEALVFGGYNRRVEHPRTPFDWLNRDEKAVDAYIADPLCGFTASAGLYRDMLTGISYVQKLENLENMNKTLPVYFIAGGDDPVGSYGEGVHRSAEAFRAAGMENVSVRIYPLCRHELLNEVNKNEVYEGIAKWLMPIIGEKKV